MKVAIHHTKSSFSEQWIEYCKSNNISFKIVDAYDSDIIAKLEDCDVFMWHHHHANYRDVLAAKPILFSLEQAGKKVFPDFNTGWHFDDKVAQKYLLEAINAPLVKSYVFYDRSSAEQWLYSTSLPKVFKLKGGATGINVRLVRNKSEGKRLIRKAFGKGFPAFDRWGNLGERWTKFKEGKERFVDMIKGFVRLFIKPEFAKMSAKEKGYVYFQDFIAGNDGDIRIIVIGQKYAYGMKRMNRKNDFRASGSSNFVYDRISDDVLKVAFETAKKLNLQSVAFDFVKGENNEPLIVEISYGFGTKGSSRCPGYWTNDLTWHERKFNPYAWMIEVCRITDSTES
ncbi:MAG TPA: hypothetical protein VKZ95_04680 [Sphingobacteriaceae bacterium]|nr:hypothetical protein [Sphingobacteriaceae bacterium]